MSNPMQPIPVPPIQRADVKQASRTYNTTTNGTTNVEVCPAPGEGKHALVTAVTVTNTTGGNLVVKLYLRPYTTVTTDMLIDSTPSLVPNDTYSSAIKFPNGIPISGFQTLSVALGGAGAVPIHCSWSDTVQR